MRKIIKNSLVMAAVRARRQAVAPYSKFKVGAALLSKDGAVHLGANVESASYGLTCCAERIALFKALTEGAREFVAVAVVARVSDGPMPCGACRQLLAEYAPHAAVWVADTARPTRLRQFTVAQLLPRAFRSFRGSGLIPPVVSAPTANPTPGVREITRRAGMRTT